MIYLPEMVDKIKDTIEGLKGNWQDYEAHKAATPEFENVHGMQDMIQTLTALFGAEYGRNENGNWVRWNNGLQMCWHYIGNIENITPASSKTAGMEATTYRYDIVDIPFPKPFLTSTPIIIPDANPNNHGDMEVNALSRSSTVFKIRVHSLANFTLIYSVSYIAIGWWKTPENPAEWSEE